MADTRQAPYYAQGATVWKSPVERPNEDGGTLITVGFPICEMHEMVGEEGAENLAAMLCGNDQLREMCAELAGAFQRICDIDNDPRKYTDQEALAAIFDVAATAHARYKEMEGESDD